MKRNFLWASNIALILATAVPLRAADDAKVNTLSPAEKADGWKLLFNGRDLSGWHNFKREGVRPGWQVKDGALVCIDPHDAGDIVTTDKFDGFELQLEPVKLVGRDDVPRVMGINADERAVFYLPARADTFALEVVPAAEVPAIEQKLPPVRFLRRAERVDLCVIGGPQGDGGGENQSDVGSPKKISF